MFKRCKQGQHTENNLTHLFFLSVLTTSLARATADDVKCSNAPPGVRKVISGVDLARLDLMPLDFTTDNGFKSPIIDFTCDEGRVYAKDSVNYQLPDQIWQIVKNPGGWLTADVHLYKSSSDLRSRMVLDVGGKMDVRRFAFSVGASYSQLQETITRSIRYISDVSNVYSSTRVDLKPNVVLQMNRIAKQYLETDVGSQTYESNPQAYHRFIEQFGTHYFSVANFGGHIRSVFETEASYFYSHREEQVKNNAEASFLNYFFVHAGGENSSRHVDSQFTALTKHTMRYYGGSTNLLSPGAVQTWQPTIDGNPWLTSGELKPISDLIPNDTQRTSMEQAVEQHMLQAYVQETRRLMAHLTSKVNGSTTGSQLEGRLVAMEALPPGSLVKADLENLGEDINRQLTVPDWFIKNTKFCYTWRPVGVEGNCDGGTMKRFCTRPGDLTPITAQSSNAVCRTHWSFQSEDFDSWFSQIQVCYCWHSDGNQAKCVTGANGVLCFPVNKYSLEFKDESFQCNGVCQLSWKLDVPDSAPIWMRAMNLCFSWYTSGRCAQCGPSNKKSICSTAGQWTPYHQPPNFTFLNSSCSISPYTNLIALLVMITSIYHLK